MKPIEILTITRCTNGYVCVDTTGQAPDATVHPTMQDLVERVMVICQRTENPPPTGEGRMTRAEFESLSGSPESIDPNVGGRVIHLPGRVDPRNDTA